MLNAAKGETKRVLRRKGLATLTLLITAVVILACCALAMDVAFVSNKQVQLEVAAEASARAAAADLMESGAILRAGWGERASLWPLVRRAHEEAVRIAARNSVASRPVVLRTNADNDPGGETLVGWLPDPSAPGGALIPWAGAGPLNSMDVQLTRTRAHGNPLTFWFATRLGMAGADRVIHARATIDQRVYGFRPVHDVTVPMLPLVQILPDADTRLDSQDGEPDNSPDSWLAAARGAADNYVVDPRGPAVSGGRDGMGELRLSLSEKRQADGPPCGRISAWFPGSVSRGPSRFRDLMLRGMDAADLQPLAGQVQLGDVVAAALVQADDGSLGRTQLWNLLRQIRGHKRIWPMVAPVGDESGKPGGYEFVGFAAGCVVDCCEDGGGDRFVVVQPMPLQTCTALVGPGVPINPWIGKLVMTQ